MAETLRELVVALSLDSSNFSRNMRTINQQIKALCEERGLYYLDLNAEFSDENGYLLTDYAQPDGIHLLPEFYPHWAANLIFASWGEIADV